MSNSFIKADTETDFLCIDDAIEDTEILRSFNHERKKCKRPVFTISAQEVNRCGGLVITKPGVWKVCENIEFKPNKPAAGQVAAAITIRSSHVVLDLGSYHISQHVPDNPRDQVPFTIGILIPDIDPANPDLNAKSLESIYILGKNALISDFSMYGIRVFAHTYDIKLSNLTVKNCGHLASRALRPAGSQYFPHSFGTNPFGVGGIAIGESTVLGMGPNFFTPTVRPTQPAPLQNRTGAIRLDDVSSLNNFYMSLMLINATNVTINACHFDNAFSDDPGIAGVQTALLPVAANFSQRDGIDENRNPSDDPCVLNMTITNSTFNNTILSGEGAFSTSLQTAPGNTIIFGPVGIAYGNGHNGNFENCEVNNTTCEYITNATISAYLGSRNENSTFVNCHFDKTNALTSIQSFHESGRAGGVAATKSSRSLTLINCTSNGHRQNGNLQLPTPVAFNSVFPTVSGYSLVFVKGLIMENCESSDLIVNGPLTARTPALGFDIAESENSAANDTALENTVLRNCVAAGVQTRNGGRVAGFSFSTNLGTPFVNATLRTVSVENCVAEGCIAGPATGFGAVSSVGNGFYIEQNNPQTTIPELRSFPISLTGCKALHNKGLPSATFIRAGTTMVTRYSSGFYLENARRHALTECEAIDNIYGFLLNNCDRCSLRFNRADNNVDLGPTGTGTTGEGFTDLGPCPGTPGQCGNTPATPGISTSLFEANHAFANGSNTAPNIVGQNKNYNVFYGAGQTSPLPLLAGSLTGAAFPSNNSFRPVDNISMIN